MNDSAETTHASGSYLGRLILFWVFSTIGMVSIGIAALAPLVVSTCADRTIVQAQQQRIERLREIRDQQAELLERAGQPGVVEKAAIQHLHYQPAENPGAAIRTAPESWPELEQALGRLSISADKKESSNPVQTYAEILIDKPRSRHVLLIIGGALLIVSLTCFLKR